MNHHMLKPTVMIGKEGITENIIKQIKAQLKRKKIIKVKFLSSAVKDNKKQLVKELAERAGARVVHSVGFIAVIERHK